MNKFVAKYGRILVPLITPYGENEEVCNLCWIDSSFIFDSNNIRNFCKSSDCFRFHIHTYKNRYIIKHNIYLCILSQFLIVQINTFLCGFIIKWNYYKTGFYSKFLCFLCQRNSFFSTCTASSCNYWHSSCCSLYSCFHQLDSFIKC